MCQLNLDFVCDNVRLHSVPMPASGSGLAKYACKCTGYYMNNPANVTGACIPRTTCVDGNPVLPGSCAFTQTAAACPAGVYTATCYPGLIVNTADMCTFDSKAGGALCSCPDGYGRFPTSPHVYDSTIQTYHALSAVGASQCVPLGNNCSVPVQYMNGAQYAWSFYLLQRDGTKYGSGSGGITDTTTTWVPLAQFSPTANQCTVTATVQSSLDHRAAAAAIENATCDATCISDYYMCENDYMGAPRCKCKFGFKYEPLAHLVSQFDAMWSKVICDAGTYAYIIPGTTNEVGCEPMPCFFPKTKTAFDPDNMGLVPEVQFVQATASCDHLLCETSKIAKKQADGSCQCKDALDNWSGTSGATPCNSLEQPPNMHCEFYRTTSVEIAMPGSFGNRASIDMFDMPTNGPCDHSAWDFVHSRVGFSETYKTQCEAWNLAHSPHVAGVYALDANSAALVTDGEPGTMFAVNSSVPAAYQFWGVGFSSKKYISEIMVGAPRALNFRVYTSNRLGYLFDPYSVYTNILAINSLTSANGVAIGTSSLATLFQLSPYQKAKAIVFRSSLPAVPLAISNLTVIHGSASYNERHEGFVYGSASGRPAEQADPSATYNSGANLQYNPFIMWFGDELVSISTVSFVLERELQSGETIQLSFLDEVKPGRPQDATYVGTTVAAPTATGQYLSVLTKNMAGSHVWIEPPTNGMAIGLHDVYLAPQQYVYEQKNK